MSPIYVPGKVTLKKESVAADPYYNNVSLLLHGDGANGSTTIVDSSPSPKTVTAVGNAQISTAQSKFGGSSLVFDGAGDYLEAPHSNDYNFGPGDFTIECWLWTGQTSAGTVAAHRTSGGAANTNWLLQTIANKISLFLSDGTTYQVNGLASTSSINNSQWRHIAASRSGSTIRLFIDGVVENTATWAGSISSTSRVLQIGNDNVGSFLNGYIDDLRITKGVARYTSNFTPPTQPFIGKPIVGNDLYYYATSLLLKGDGTNGSTNIVDSSFDPKTITANGDAQISTAQSKFGGSSIAFDGAGDYISTPNNAAFDYGTSNFTIEFWYKFAATPSADQYIYSQRLDSNNFVYIYATGSSFVLYKFDGFGSLTLTGSTTHNTTTWSHLAAVRNGTTFTLYKDGTALNSITNNATFASLGVQLDIGIWSGPSPSLAFNGYIDDLRITKGIARYTSNFTPPGSLPTY